MSPKIEKTKHFSKKIGNLANGCKYCVKGSKLVIFITGLCSKKCFFCPTSDDKQYKDVAYANERPLNVHNYDEMISGIIEEAKIQDAKGAGITGGDPLQKIERTCNVIKELKKEFGNIFHIHLYTPLEHVNKKKLEKLFSAGLDEIRFHPEIIDDKLWGRLNLAKEFSWDVGVEIPVIPEYEKDTKNLIMYIHDSIDFLNLNELEMADNKHSKLAEMGYECKDHTSYAVKHSEKLAKELLDFISKREYSLNVHYCSAKLKDSVQLGNRILRTGKNVKKDFEKITDEGLLIRGIIYLEDLKPKVGYNNMLKKLSQKERIKYISRLENLRNELMEKQKIKGQQLIIDNKKLRLISSVSNAKFISKKRKDVTCAIVTEYPTYDQIEIEIDFLNHNKI